MNRLFGFLKDKINEATQENKQQLNIIAEAISDSDYSQDKVMATLHSAKSNYLNWNILIANEASTGLYYSQMHNRNICSRKIKSIDQLSEQLNHNKIKLSQIQQVNSQLKQMANLNTHWVTSVNNQVDKLFSSNPHSEKHPEEV